MSTTTKRKPAFADVAPENQDEARAWVEAGKPKAEPTTENGDVQEADPVLIPTSLRLPQALIDRLNRASFEQKTARKRPQTRQDIIIDALGQWLDRYEQRNK